MFSKSSFTTGNSPTANGWASISAPLDSPNGNSLTNLFPNPGPGGGANPLDFDQVYVWTGLGYTIYTIDSDYASGVGDINDNDTVEPYAPMVSPGTLVYIHNNGGNVSIATTNTLAGVVHYDTAPDFSTTFVGKTTNVLVMGLNYVASKLPVGGGLNTVLQLQTGASGGNGPLDFNKVFIPNIVNGQFVNYTVYTVDSDYASGYGDINDNEVFVEPTVPVGVGFIVNYTDANSTGNTTYKWIQSY